MASVCNSIYCRQYYCGKLCDFNSMHEQQKQEIRKFSVEINLLNSGKTSDCTKKMLSLREQ